MKNIYYYVMLCLIFSLLFARTEAKGKERHKTDSLVSALARADKDTVKLQLLEQIYLQTFCKDQNRSRIYLNEYLSLAHRIKKESYIEQAERWLGLYYTDCLWDFDKAIQWFEHALKRTERSGNKVEKALILSCMARAMELHHDNAGALAYYTRSMHTDSDPDKVKGILGNMGSLYSSIGDYPNAARCFERAYNIQYSELVARGQHTRNDTLNLMGLLISIADVDLSMAQYDKAQRNYMQTKVYNGNINNTLIDLLVLTGIGRCLEYKGDYRGAVTSLEVALGLSRTLKDHVNEAEILTRIGNIYLKDRQTDSGMRLAKESERVCAGRQHAGLAGTYLLFGRIYTVKKDFGKAVYYLKEAVAMFNLLGKMDEAGMALKALSGTYEKMNRVGDAFDAYKQYIVKRDSVFSLDKARQITSTELSGAFARKQLTDSLVQARKDAGVKLHMQRQRGLIYGGFVSFGLVLLVAFFIYRNYTLQKQANVTITNTNKALRAEKQVSETLLLNILPSDVAEELKEKGKVKAKLFDNVTVLMTDFVGFTRSGERLSAEALVAELHTCFEAFDHIMGKYRIEKIKTVGDAYLAVCGLPVADEKHAENVVAAAIEINAFMQDRLKQMGDRTFDIRIGIHSGSLVAGIVGVKKFAYDIWGDTVNTAARMEQHSEAGKINISGATYALVKHKFDCVYRGEIEAKNKGAMKMYFVGLKSDGLL